MNAHGVAGTSRNTWINSAGLPKHAAPAKPLQRTEPGRFCRSEGLSPTRLLGRGTLVETMDRDGWYRNPNRAFADRTPG